MNVTGVGITSNLRCYGYSMNGSWWDKLLTNGNVSVPMDWRASARAWGRRGGPRSSGRF